MRPAEGTGEPLARHRPAAQATLGRCGPFVLASLAVLPRARGLGEWWLNPDEGTYYAIATRTSGAWRDIMQNAHPPLYYLLLRALGLVTHDFVWFRVFSLVCGVVAVYAAWLVARELAGPGGRGIVAGLVAAAIMAFSPGAVAAAQVVRPYALQLALLLSALLCLLRYLGTRSGRALGGYVALSSLALLTHYSSVLALGACAALAFQQGLAQRWSGRAWRPVIAAHAALGALMLALYVLHLRHLVGTTLSDAALDGWLGPYMVRSPGSAWVAFLGFTRLLGASWLVGPLAVSLVTALGLSAASGDRRPLVLGAAGLTLAVVGAAAGLYPFGPTRHSLWLTALVVPVLGWLAAGLVALPRRTGVLVLGLAATLLLSGETVGRWLGLRQTPGAAPERVLRTADVERMRDVLAPDGRPELVVMSRQTFHLLLPLYPSGWEDAQVAPDGSAMSFPIGGRRIVAARGWELRAIPGVGGDTSPLIDVLSTADREFGRTDGERGASALVLAGGWEFAIMADLRSLEGPEPVLRSAREVPGLAAAELDVGAYRRALEASGRATSR